MSNHVTFTKLKRVFPELEKIAERLGAYWYVLLDKNGKVRDWTFGCSMKSAIYDFHTTRKYGFPGGYTVERRGKVEAK